MTYAAKTLRMVLQRNGDGLRECIPVFGTGLNIHAATLAGYPQKDDWRQLLEKVCRRVLPPGKSIDTLPGTHLGLWEAILCLWAKENGVYPFQAENELQKFICEELRLQETECKSFELYQQVALAGFKDILSLNFDRRIALSHQDHSFLTGPSPCPMGGHGETLFRHSMLRHSNGTSTRVWYPHGDVKKASTIKFGIRKYGFYIAVLHEYIGGLSGAWRYRRNSMHYLPDTKVKASLLRQTQAWPILFLTRPLVFIGCGLSLQEWPLWWLLRRRAEMKKEPAIYLTSNVHGVPEHLRFSSEVEVITFESPNELWTILLDCLGS